MRYLKLLPLASLLAAAPPALASDQGGTLPSQWFEEFSGGTYHATDAGNILASANITRGAGPLTLIGDGLNSNPSHGTLVGTADADLFCIRITDPASWSASVTGSSSLGYLNLALFSSTGVGIAAFNGNPSNGNANALLPVGVAAAFSPGIFFLAISRDDISGFGSTLQYPLNAASQAIFLQTAGLVAPDPSTSDHTLAAWFNTTPPGGFQLFNFNYQINLTGSGFHALPAPGAGSLLAFGGLLLARRRRSR